MAQSPTPVSGTEFLVPQLPLAAVVEIFVTDNNGELHLPMWGGGNAPSWTWIFQAATYDGVGYDLSNGLEVVIGAF